MIARRLCVLGEPRLSWEGGGEAWVTGRPGRVLVALLVSDGSVSLDQLADLVWAGDPPETARAALHVHLGALRKLFARVPDGLGIERTGERYRLVRSGWDLDVDVVGEHSTKAKELLAVGAPDAAAVQLQAALDLWTGVPFTVGGSEVSSTATYQLELRRLELEELLAEALLAAGEAGRAEVLAVRLVDAEPYRERRWGQLMRALAMQGRAGDALAAFDRVGEVLMADLGVDPGEELNCLQRSILTRSLGPEVSRPDDHEREDIPASLGDLVGRDALIHHVETLLGRLTPVVVSGAPGAGKTRLAIELARRAAAAGRRVCWVDLRNAGFDQRMADDGVVRFARRYAGGLVVLDNAEHAADDVTRLIDRCHRIAPSVQLLVTSRNPMPGPHAVVTVPPLDLPVDDDPDVAERAGAVRMLRALLALLAPQAELSGAEAAALCRQLGGLPLAIRIAADLARSLPPGELGAASLLRLGPGLEASVGAVLEQMGPAAARVFASISVVSGQLDADLVSALAGGRAAAEHVSRLVDGGLVQFSAGDDAPYSVPEPLREIGLAMLGGSDRRRTLDRLVGECLARAQARSLPGATAGGRRLEDLLRRELPWHRQSLQHLAATGEDQTALELVAALELQLYSVGWWRENFELQDAALAIPGRPSPQRARAHAARGRPGLFHQFDETDNQVALAMAVEIGDAAEQARARYHLGVIRWWSGRYDEALEQLDLGRQAAERAGDLFLLGENLRFTGMTHVVAGNAQRGLEIQMELVGIVERMPELEMLLPHLWMHLGHSRRHVGDLEAALADLSAARRGLEDVGNRASLVHVCAGLAEVLADLHRHDEALEAADRALAASAGTSLAVYDPWTLCTTARIHVATGHHDLACRAAGSAVDALRRTFDGETHRVALELASVASGLGEHRAALRLAGLARATPDRRELPFRSPGEGRRLDEAVAAGTAAVGDEAAALLHAGASSTLGEASALLLHRP